MSGQPLTRAALIDAAARAIYADEVDRHVPNGAAQANRQWDSREFPTDVDDLRGTARAALDAVLPLIADAIMATRDGDAARDCATENAAYLVRALAAGGQS